MKQLFARPTPDMPKAEALVRVVIAYVVALMLSGVVLTLSDAEPLWRALWADIVATVIIFAFSRWHKNSSFYDPYWTVIPPMALLWWISVSPEPASARSLIVLALVLYWATRLTCHWAYYWPGLHHEDWRYPMLRRRAGKHAFWIDLLGIHLYPTFQVFLGMLPLYALAIAPGQALNALDALAFVVTFGAVTLQMLSDFELHAFEATRNPGDTLETGLWSLSRHPNYLGEIGFWVGLALFGCAAQPMDFWWIVIGAVTMAAMFRLVSIPMMEKRSLGRRPGYAETQKRIPMLLPRIWKRQ